MKFRTLLLSSAAAFAVVGGAQAADLSVAEPVDYVKVCDAFGAGYWYIPGTDTCLKIGGLIRADVNFHDEVNVDARDFHESQWDFATEARLDVYAKSMTEYGPLTAFVELRAQSNNADSSNALLFGDTGDPGSSDRKYAYLDTAYVELGMLLAGRAGSVYDYAGGFNWDYNDFDSDFGADQVRLTWAASGFGIQLAIEDPRDRWGSALDDSYDLPNIVGNISFAQGNWSAQLSAGFAETDYGSGFGVQAATTIKLDSIAPGDALLLKAAWAQNEVWRYAGDMWSRGSDDGSIWSAAVSFQHFWAPTLSSAVTFQYFSQDDLIIDGDHPYDDNNAYEIGANLVWAPVTGFTAGIEGGYAKRDNFGPDENEDTWNVKMRVERTW